ncbi:LysR family transcriptional regulator [Streptomyces sp. NBC_01511]|uniref:LysR family transcriptional regulator n=1 Tax=unclassified Streptomyces TaxID=2593676 RepID=UPI003864D28F
MKLSQCRAFVSVADTGTFTAAAKLIGVSQSAVSHAVAALEKELGIDLLSRDHGSITLTAAGHRVLQSARIMLKQAQEIASVTSSMASTAELRLCIGVSRSLGKGMLPRLLGELRTRRPDMALDVRLGSCTQVEEWLRRGLVDVGIAALARGGLTTVPLLRDRIHVVLPAGHSLTAAPTVHVRQLANGPLLMPSGATERELCSFFQDHDVTPRITFRVDDPATLLTLTANGHGVTLLPGIAIPAKVPRLRALPLVPAVPCDQLIGMSKAGSANPYAAEFAELVKRSVQHHDWQDPAVRTRALSLVTMPGG